MSLPLQSLFDKITTHLLKQNQPAVSPNDGCKYKTDDGLKCAIGCLIDDQHYNPNFEGLTPECFISPSASNPELSLGIFQAVVDSQQITFDVNHEMEEKRQLCNFLRKLQSIHDDCYPNQWRKALKNFALDHELTFNQP